MFCVPDPHQGSQSAGGTATAWAVPKDPQEVPRPPELTEPSNPKAAPQEGSGHKAHAAVFHLDSACRRRVVLISRGLCSSMIYGRPDISPSSAEKFIPGLTWDALAQTPGQEIDSDLHKSQLPLTRPSLAAAGAQQVANYTADFKNPIYQPVCHDFLHPFSIMGEQLLFLRI